MDAVFPTRSAACRDPNMKLLREAADKRIALRHAEQHLSAVATNVFDGARPEQFGFSGPEQMVSSVIGEVRKARFEYERALCSLLAGEAWSLTPDLQSVARALRTRLTRNVTGYSPSREAEFQSSEAF